MGVSRREPLYQTTARPHELYCNEVSSRIIADLRDERDQLNEAILARMSFHVLSVQFLTNRGVTPVSGTLQLNLKSPRVASIQKASTLENSLRHHWTTTDSNLRVAANFCSKLATAYSFRLHPQGIAHLCRPGTSIHPNRL
ncbi:MAG: hypothetical protein QOJ99_1173 [Bryobacterales bacterium]|jgi:hypothetical protein|nr:hypothetical protein [Bryobacterales bacterium]